MNWKRDSDSDAEEAAFWDMREWKAQRREQIGYEEETAKGAGKVLPQGGPR